MPFLETIERGITKAKDLGEISRLSGEIALRENHRKECLAALGEKYYDAVKHGLTPDGSVLCRELETVDQELEQLRREVQKLRKIMICPGCGAKLTCFGAFCPVCGAELIKKHVCPSCGAALDPDANFCVNCGNRTAGQDSRED